jgi:hypothetical protein
VVPLFTRALLAELLVANMSELNERVNRLRRSDAIGLFWCDVWVYKALSPRPLIVIADVIVRDFWACYLREPQ